MNKTELNKILKQLDDDEHYYGEFGKKFLSNSDIRALPGVTVISSVEPIAYAEQDKNKFKAILTVKVDGYPWITKGGFSREKMDDIASNIRKVPGVKSFFTKPEEITSM